MRQALLGVSIFIGLQLVYAIVLFVVTIWELRQLDTDGNLTGLKEDG